MSRSHEAVFGCERRGASPHRQPSGPCGPGAQALVTSGTPLWLTETALLETAYVLERLLLGKMREEVVDALIALVREPNLQVQGLEKGTVLRALLHCRPSRRVSFGDALLCAAAHDHGGEIYTFEARFPGRGITVRAP